MKASEERTGSVKLRLTGERAKDAHELTLYYVCCAGKYELTQFRAALPAKDVLRREMPATRALPPTQHRCPGEPQFGASMPARSSTVYAAKTAHREGFRRPFEARKGLKGGHWDTPCPEEVGEETL